MVPAQAPLPTDCKLPFHPASGNHTSILISESGTGLMVAATRQNTGSVRYDCDCLPLPGWACGRANRPDTTVSALVMFMFLSLSPIKPSQLVAPKSGAMLPAAMANTSVAGLFMGAAPY